MKENNKETKTGSKAIANQSIQKKHTGESLPAVSTAQLKENTIIQKVEEEEMLQGKFDTAQLVEEEELLQGKFETAQLVEEEELLQGKFETTQLAEEEELLQGKFGTVQKKESSEENKTGMPDNLKSGIEALSGVDISDVKVNYNSDRPAQLHAHAYAQGTDIHIAPGQEKHLAHEAWHTVQQKQGRVNPTVQMKKNVPVNDDPGLENEADVMGQKALNYAPAGDQSRQLKKVSPSNTVVQAEAETPESSIEGPGIGNSDASATLGGETEFMGGTLSVEGNEDGDAKIEFEHDLFSASGERKVIGDPQKGVFEYTLSGSPPAIETPEASFSIPLPPIPLGVPGLFATSSIDGSAKASLGGSASIKITQKQGKFDFASAQISGSLEAKAEGRLGIKGGVTAGIPGLAGITVGAHGDLKAELSGVLELMPTKEGLKMNSEIAGEASGEAGVFASGSLLFYVVEKKIPVVEGKLGSFKGKKENMPFNFAGLKQLANLTSYDFTKDPADEEKAKAVAEKNVKKSWMSRIFG